MVDTPESKTKKKIKALLDTYGEQVYRFMPVPTGYGSVTVDYLGCITGVFFAVEAKAPGAKPTLRQEAALADIRAAGGTTFVVDSDVSLAGLRAWLDEVVKL